MDDGNFNQGYYHERLLDWAPEECAQSWEKIAAARQESFLRAAVQVALASEAHAIEIHADREACEIQWQPGAWAEKSLEKLQALLAGAADDGASTVVRLAHACCQFTALRADLRVTFSEPGGFRSLQFDAGGACWCPQTEPNCSIRFARLGPRPRDGQVNPVTFDVLSPILSAAWPELDKLHHSLFDVAIPIRLNGGDFSQESLDPEDWTTPTFYTVNMELFRLAVVHPQPQYNNLKVSANARGGILGAVRPLVFACISSEGEIIEVPSDASVRAYAGLSLHASPIVHDTQMRGDTPVLSHLLRVLRYGTAIYQTQEGVSPQTRAVLDGSALPTDSSFQWALPSPELDLQRKFLERLYLLGIKAWRHRLEHDTGIVPLLMGHHRNTLDAFKASVE